MQQDFRVFDVIVVGLGAMGSAAAQHLAVRGQRVLGVEQFSIGHDRGSSHGSSRIIRLAYFEHPAYMPLLVRVYELGRRLERDSGRDLLTMPGGLMIGRSDRDVLTGSVRSAREHRLAHDVLDAAAIRQRFPPFRPAPDEHALYETQAGVLRPEACVRAQIECAIKAGAQIVERAAVVDWSANPAATASWLKRGRPPSRQAVSCSARRVGAGVVAAAAAAADR